jgi:hypothetical protein
MPPSSGMNSKSSKKPAEAGSKHQNVQLSLNYIASVPRRLHFFKKESRIVKLLNDAFNIGTIQCQDICLKGLGKINKNLQSG